MIPISLFIVLFSYAVHCHHDIINFSFCSGIKHERILGTDLNTGTFYKVTFSNSDTEQITWSLKTHSTYGHRYIVRDFAYLKYEKGGPFYVDSHWFFLSAKGHPGWYHMANRRIPGLFATWSHKSGETVGSNKYYMVLDPLYSTENPKLEYLFKPVKEGKHYRLQSKLLPNASMSIYSNHIYINNNPVDAIKFNKGGEWYPYSLFKFETVNDGIRFMASISKIELVGKFTIDNNATDFLTSEELASTSIFRNNGTSTFTQEYHGRKEIGESVFIHRPVNFTNFYKVGVEDAVEIEGNPGIPFLKTPTFNQQLISFYSGDQSSTPTWNYTHSRDFYTNQTIEVTKCTEYEFTASVNIVKDYPIEYIVYFEVNGKENGEQISSVDLRDEHFNEDGNDANFQAEYVDILDEYTILAKAKAKMWVTFARDSTVDGKGSKIDKCTDEYVCNQLEN